MNVMRQAVLAALSARLGSKLSVGVPQEARGFGEPTFPTGLPALDALVGGVPRGRLSELVGHGSSGKLSVLLGVLREALGQGSARGGGRLAALVDLSGTVFPGQPWAAGRLLVVRPPDLEQAARALDILVSSACLSVVAFEASGVRGSLPEAVQVRTARLARETGTAVVACADRALFGGLTTLRLEVTPAPGGELRVEVRKSRQGPLGSVRVPWRAARAVPLPWASRDAARAGAPAAAEERPETLRRGAVA
jgi:hypothetical protein